MPLGSQNLIERLNNELLPPIRLPKHPIHLKTVDPHSIQEPEKLRNASISQSWASLVNECSTDKNHWC